MDKKNRKNKKFTLLDILHIVVIACVLGYTFRAVICVDPGWFQGNFFMDLKKACLNAGLNEILTFVGAVAFVLFGIVGIYEYAYANGVPVLAPDFFIRMKENKYEKQAEKMMKLYYEKDIDFIREYEKERTGYILQSMGIEEKQFHHIRYELIKARAMSAHSVKELQNKAEKILYDKRFIVDQTKDALCRRVYKEVDYFINLYSAFYEPELCQDAGHIMTDFILLSLKDEVDFIDYILIPTGSNLLLGLEVGKILRKPVIAMQEHPRIKQDEFWDGEYRRKENAKNNIIIVHDVLVTGKRIYESVEKLPANTYNIKGLFCLMKYEHQNYHPKRELKKHNIYNVKCLLKTDEKILKEYKND